MSIDDFHICNRICSSNAVTQQNLEELRAQNKFLQLNSNEYHIERVLGLLWDDILDSFKFTVNFDATRYFANPEFLKLDKRKSALRKCFISKR